MISENNKWMADHSRETGYNWFLQDGSRDDMPTGCMEHMFDVQCSSSRISIIENNDGRVVVNWPSEKATLEINGKHVYEGKDFRNAVEYNIDGSARLIIWLKIKSHKTTRLSIKNQ